MSEELENISTEQQPTETAAAPVEKKKYFKHKNKK